MDMQTGLLAAAQHEPAAWRGPWCCPECLVLWCRREWRVRGSAAVRQMLEHTVRRTVGERASDERLRESARELLEVIEERRRAKARRRAEEQEREAACGSASSLRRAA